MLIKNVPKYVKRYVDTTTKTAVLSGGARMTFIKLQRNYDEIENSG